MMKETGLLVRGCNKKEGKRRGCDNLGRAARRFLRRSLRSDMNNDMVLGVY